MGLRGHGVLGTEPQSPAGAASVLTCRAVSPGPAGGPRKPTWGLSCWLALQLGVRGALFPVGLSRSLLRVLGLWLSGGDPLCYLLCILGPADPVSSVGAEVPLSLPLLSCLHTQGSLSLNPHTAGMKFLIHKSNASVACLPYCTWVVCIGGGGWLEL